MQTRNGENRALTIAAVALAVLGVVAALYVARSLFIPIALACVLALVLAPIVRLLCHVGVPRALASAGVVILAVLFVVLTMLRLSTPASEWFARLPLAAYRLRYAFQEVINALQDMRQITEDVARLSRDRGGEGEGEGEQVVVEGPDLAQLFLTHTGELLVIIAITVVLLYFLLANGYLFLRKTVHVLPRLSDKKRAVEIGRALQVEVSRYLLTITLINIGLGVATAATMAAFGIPDPLLWGVMATTLNFIPYVGTILTAGAILLASAMTVTTAFEALLPPLAFIGLTALEGNFVTPILVGRRMTLNPVIVFSSLLLWGWMWGIAGLLLAVPLLVIFKILCDHIEPLHVAGEYLSSLPPGTASSAETTVQARTE